MDQPAFGKVIKSQSFFNGRIKGSRIEYQIPELVQNRQQALKQVLDCLNLLDTGKTKKVLVTVETDKNGEYKMVTRQYEVET